MVIAETCYLLCESDTFQRLIVAEKWMTLALMHLHTIRIIVLGQEQDGGFFSPLLLHSTWGRHRLLLTNLSYGLRTSFV